MVIPLPPPADCQPAQGGWGGGQCRAWKGLHRVTLWWWWASGSSRLSSWGMARMCGVAGGVSRVREGPAPSHPLSLTSVDRPPRLSEPPPQELLHFAQSGQLRASAGAAAAHPTAHPIDIGTTLGAGAGAAAALRMPDGEDVLALMSGGRREDLLTMGRRRPGRPKGTKDSQPRRVRHL
jgi:hypothetical protein